MTWENVMWYNKKTGKGVDIDYVTHPDGSIEILHIDTLKEGDLNV